MPDEIVVYCCNGHLIGHMPDASHTGYSSGRMRQMAEEQYARENERQNFCAKCGEPSINACPSCETAILLENRRPAYCSVCGKPFPWTERSLATANEYIDDLEKLSADEKDILKGTLPDISRDTPRTELAVSLFSKILHKVGPSAGGVLLNMVTTFTTETVKNLVDGWRW